MDVVLPIWVFLNKWMFTFLQRISYLEWPEVTSLLQLHHGHFTSTFIINENVIYLIPKCH